MQNRWDKEMQILADFQLNFVNKNKNRIKIDCEITLGTALKFKTLAKLFCCFSYYLFYFFLKR